MGQTVRFDVEHAGCPSCAARVEAALAAIGTVHDVTIDEEGDIATVTFSPLSPIDEPAVNAVLALASTGTGHEYRLENILADAP